jgi:hypothetical protein
MKNQLLVAFLAASTLAATSAIAGGNQSELQFSGSLASNSSNGTSSSSTNINAAYGYSFTPQIIGRASIFLNGNDSGGSKSTMTYLGVGAKYYFSEGHKSAWVPFVLADLQTLAMDNAGTTTNGMGYDAGVGVSDFLTETISFDITALMNSFTIKGSNGAPDSSQTGTRVDFGFTARF